MFKIKYKINIDSEQYSEEKFTNFENLISFINQNPGFVLRSVSIFGEKLSSKQFAEFIDIMQKRSVDGLFLDHSLRDVESNQVIDAVSSLKFRAMSILGNKFDNNVLEAIKTVSIENNKNVSYRIKQDQENINPQTQGHSL